MLSIGMISFAHMHAYSYASVIKEMEGIQLTAIFDDDQERGMKAAEQFDTKFVSNLELLRQLDLDGVIVCSENNKHKTYANYCAKEKIPVLCEKPIATTLADGRDMLKTFEKADVPLYIAFPCRFHSAVEEMKSKIQSGSLGRVLAIKATNHGQMPGGWFIDKEQSGGGAVMDHTVHVVDLIRWFTGKEFVKIYAEKGTLLHDVQIDDCGLLSMRMENDIFATLDTSWSRPKAFPTWGDVTIEIIGDKGITYLDMFAQNITIYEPAEITSRYDNFGDNSDYRMISAFVSALEGQETELATGYDGYKALEAALNAYESADSSRVVNF